MRLLALNLLIWFSNFRFLEFCLGWFELLILLLLVENRYKDVIRTTTCFRCIIILNLHATLSKLARNLIISILQHFRRVRPAKLMLLLLLPLCQAVWLLVVFIGCDKIECLEGLPYHFSRLWLLHIHAFTQDGRAPLLLEQGSVRLYALASLSTWYSAVSILIHQLLTRRRWKIDIVVIRGHSRVAGLLLLIICGVVMIQSTDRIAALWGEFSHEIVNIFICEDWDSIDSKMAQFDLIFWWLVLLIFPLVTLDV